MNKKNNNDGIVIAANRKAGHLYYLENFWEAGLALQGWEVKSLRAGRAQLIESYILHPIVMSKTMKLHPVTIIIGLLIFGHFFGIIGMLIATPVTAIFKTIWLFLDDKYKITKRLEERNRFGEE